MKTFCALVSVAALCVALAAFGLSTRSASAAALHGIGFSEGCASPLVIGQTYECDYLTINNLDTAGDTLTVTAIVDVVHADAGDVNSGNVLPVLSLSFIGGATCNFGQTICTLPPGSSIFTNASYGFYTTQPTDTSPLTDTATLTWQDLCNSLAPNCPVGDQFATSGSSAILQTPTSTPTFTPTNTPPPTVAASTSTPVSTVTPPSMVKSPTNQNVFLCDPAQAATCIANGGTLNTALINEAVDNVQAPLGAYEFQVKFDNAIWSNVLVSDGSGCPAACGDPGASLIGTNFARVPDCTASVVTENYIDFGCTSTGDPASGWSCASPGPFACPATLAQITLFANEADLVQRLRPGNDNGVVTPVLDEHCELATTLGHPEPGADNLQPGQSSQPGAIGFGSNGATGGLIPCTDAFVTVRLLEGDLNKDCAVTALDAQLIASHYATAFGVTGYDRWLDLEPSFGDFDIDIKDLQKVLGREGSTCGTPVPDQPPVAPVDP